MLANMRDIPDLSINQLAEFCYTTPPPSATPDQAVWPQELPGAKNSLPHDIRRYVCHNRLIGERTVMPEDIKALIHGSVASTHARFDKLFTIKSIELIVDEIHRCKRVIIWGYGICFMESMPEMNLFMDGKNCIFCMSTPEQRQTDTDLREGDLAIVLLPDAIANMRDTQSCLQSAKEHNAEFTAITSCEAELFALCAAYLVSDPGARNMIDRYCLQYTLAYNSTGKNI